MTGIDQLDDVDILLEQHDRGRDDGNDPRNLAVNLVGARHLESAGTPGAGKEAARSRVGGVARLRGGGHRIRDGLEKRGRQDRRGERQQVDANEEGLVESTADEQHGLNDWSVEIRKDKVWLTYLAIVVLVEGPVGFGVDLLVALVGSTDAQSGVHVHIVTG